MYVVLVEIKVPADFADEFRGRVLLHAQNSLNEAGCRQFDVSTSPDDPHHYLLYEQYDDRAAFDAHTAADYFAAFGALLQEKGVTPELRFWSRLPPA